MKASTYVPNKGKPKKLSMVEMAALRPVIFYHHEDPSVLFLWASEATEIVKIVPGARSFVKAFYQRDFATGEQFVVADKGIVLEN